MLVATTIVVGCPAAAVLALGATGLVTSTIALSLIAIALSVAISYLGAAAWKRREASGDLLFGDLMLWGWLRRWRFERLLSHTVSLVGSGSDTAGLTRERRARLLERLSRSLEARDPRTHGHSRRVGRHAAAIAKRMALPKEEVARIRTAAILHDVGKIDTPKEIIDKAGPLSDGEYEVVKRHAPVGAQMVSALGDPRLTAFVRSHHERLDGGGYPDGLAGDAIPLGARIIAVADTFDAVTSARPYRQAMAHSEALALLAAEAGTQLDPDVVRNFRRHYSGLRPVALWAAFLALPRQAGYLLFDLPRFGSALTTAKVAAASLATVAVGTAVVHPGTPVTHSGESAAGPTRQLVTDRSAGAGSESAAGPPPRAVKTSDGSPGAGAPPPGVAETTSGTGTSSGPTPVNTQPAGDGASSNSEGGDAAAADQSDSPASSSETPSTQVPSVPVKTTPEAPTAPVASTVTSTVESTVESVGNTVNQVTAPTIEGVNGIVEKTTGGLLGGGP